MSIALNVPASQGAKPDGFGSLQALATGGRRFWWHIRAYGIIAGIMLLTLLSLVVLQFHWISRRFSIAVHHRSLEPNFNAAADDDPTATQARLLPR